LPSLVEPSIGEGIRCREWLSGRKQTKAAQICEWPSENLKLTRLKIVAVESKKRLQKSSTYTPIPMYLKSRQQRGHFFQIYGLGMGSGISFHYFSSNSICNIVQSIHRDSLLIAVADF
jgi:hypothetical protein